MFQHRLRAGVAAASLALVVAGCGGGGTSSTGAPASPSSTLVGQSAEQVLAASKKALEGATSVRYQVKGTSDKADPTSTLSFDFRIAKGKGATGSMALGGKSLTILQVGKDGYLSADSTFLTSKGAPIPGGGKGKWIKSPPQTESLLAITDLAKSFDALNADGATLSLGTPKTIDGRPTVAVVVAPKGDQDGGTLYVAAEGPAYPLLIETKGKKSEGSLTFSEYGQPVEIAAPAPASIIEIPKF